MRLFVLIFASIVFLLFVIFTIKGSKYDVYFEELESELFPLKSLYGLGFVWSGFRIFSLRGVIKSNLIKNANLLYGEQYSEYYANVVWAQSIFWIHFSLMIGFILGAVLNFPFFGFVGVVSAILFGYYFLNKMKSQVDERRNECTIELPEVVSTMALLMNSGMVLRETWFIIADSKEGPFYTLMKEAKINMENGMSDAEAINWFGIKSDSIEVKKFTSSLIQGIDKGSKDLCDSLVNQSSEMLNLKKQLMLQKGEAAASKLLLPTSLIFIGIIIIVIAAAAGMLI